MDSSPTNDDGRCPGRRFSGFSALVGFCFGVALCAGAFRALGLTKPGQILKVANSTSEPVAIRLDATKFWNSATLDVPPGADALFSFSDGDTLSIVAPGENPQIVELRRAHRSAQVVLAGESVVFRFTDSPPTGTAKEIVGAWRDPVRDSVIAFDDDGTYEESIPIFATSLARISEPKAPGDEVSDESSVERKRVASEFVRGQYRWLDAERIEIGQEGQPTQTARVAIDGDSLKLIWTTNNRVSVFQRN